MSSSPPTQQLSPQQQSLLKSQRFILEFNKNGLNCLTSQKTYSQSHDYFKKAQRTILDELKINPNNKKINQLAAVTYNNLACYYKKLNKPKVALSYLKKALEIEVYKVENWISTASTHLNICAIYSYMSKHQQAKQHANLSNRILEKVDFTQQKFKNQDQKSYNNVKMLANYNTAIELEYLKQFQQSIKYYQLTKQVAMKNQQKNSLIIKQINEGIDRVKQQMKLSKQRLLEILTKRKQNQIKGNHQFMRKNVKNYNPKDNWRSLLNNKKQKYSQYVVVQDKQKSKDKQIKQMPKNIKYQSLGKLSSIKPIVHSDNPLVQMTQSFTKITKSPNKIKQKQVNLQNKQKINK